MNWETDQLTPEQAKVIRDTLPLVGEHIGEIAKLFYQTLFNNHPDLIKNVFNRGNQKQGAQQKALAMSVAVFASRLVDENEPLPVHMLARIAHKHCALGVTESQYQIVHDNLFHAIVQVLGADTVTPPVAEAWDRVYWIMAKVLIDCEKKLYSDAGVKPGDIWCDVKVVEVKKLTPEVTTFTIESLDASKPLPKHQPGQYISVRSCLPDGAGQLRQYSLTDAGSQPGQLSFAVKAIEATDSAPAGECSNWLIANIKEGSQLQVSLPFGNIVLDTESKNPVVLISSGIGATPMMGMLSRLVKEKSDREILVLHTDKSQASDAFSSEVKKMVDGLPNARVHAWYMHGDKSDDTTTVGKHMDLKAVQFPDDATFYLCGSTNFLQSCSGVLKDCNVPEDKVQYELFTPNDWILN